MISPDDHAKSDPKLRIPNLQPLGRLLMNKTKEFNLEDRFRRTIKPISQRAAKHNKRRCEWIGKGKTFSEISAKNSMYKKNMVMGESVETALKYDIERNKYIEKFK